MLQYRSIGVIAAEDAHSASVDCLVQWISSGDYVLIVSEDIGNRARQSQQQCGVPRGQVMGMDEISVRHQATCGYGRSDDRAYGNVLDSVESSCECQVANDKMLIDHRVTQ